MAKYPFQEFTLVSWIPGASGVTDISAPTVAEVGAGTDITCDLTADGLALGGGTNGVNGETLCQALDAQTPGKVTFSPSLKGYRFTPPDTELLWDLAIHSDEGYLFVRRGIAVATAVAATDACEVYHAQFGEPIPDNSASDQNTTFTVPLFFSDFDQKAVVAA